MRKLATDDNVLAILGPFSSSECEVAYPVGNKIGIVMIAQASSKPGVAAASRPYAFRNKIDELRLAIPAVQKWKDAYNIKTVAIVHDAKDAVGRSLGTQVLPGVCKKLGLQIVNENNYVTFQTNDFDMRPQVTRLKSLKFDGIVFGGDYDGRGHLHQGSAAPGSSISPWWPETRSCTSSSPAGGKGGGGGVHLRRVLLLDGQAFGEGLYHGVSASGPRRRALSRLNPCSST